MTLLKEYYSVAMLICSYTMSSDILCLTFYAGLSGVHSACSVCSRFSLVA